MGTLTWVDGIIVAVICAIDEWVIKKWICKGNEKYRLVYTFAPIVLAIIAYIVYALVTKGSWSEGLIKGLGIGFSAMASYDAIIAIIKQKGVSGVKEIGEDVANTVGNK